MTQEELEILKKKRCREQNIIKRGTYSITDANDAPAQDMVPANPLPNIFMPPTAETMIQNSIDAMVTEYAENDKQQKAEQDDKVAEILNKFASNIQDNVSSLFNQVT